MAKGNIRKQRKRPPGRSKKPDGLDPVVSTRLPREVVDAVDAWAADQGVTRHEAVWRLLEQGLAAGDRAKLLQAAPRRDFAF